MKQRNPEATCATCPYWWQSGNQSACRKEAKAWRGREPEDWCGDHPEFFLGQTCCKCNDHIGVRDFIAHDASGVYCEKCWTGPGLYSGDENSDDPKREDPQA